MLIGTANYRHLEPLPAVVRNLEGLAGLLRDPSGWRLPAEHLTVLLDPPSADDLLEAVHLAARAATDTLLVYYAGHAIADDDLLLTLPGSDTERLFRSVRFSDVRREVAGAGHRTAVILDCAYQGPAPDVDVPGGWLLSAGPGNDLAPAPHHSALTGELLTVLAHGIPDGPATIDTDTLFLRVRHQLRAKQRAEPKQRAQGRLITLARNNGSERAAATAPEDVDELPYVQMTPAVLAESVSNLRAQGSPEKAAAALAACGRLRPDQEVAAIMTALAGLRRPADVAAVAFAAAGRDPHDLRRIYEILIELDQRALAIGLLKVVAVGLPERTARFVTVLDDTTAPAAGDPVPAPRAAGDPVPAPRAVGDPVPAPRAAGDPVPAPRAAGDPVPALLRAAVAAARQRPGRVIDLIDALLIDRREAAAELALGEAEGILASADLAVVADALRDGGRDEQAYRLYARAADAVVRRDPAAVARIVAALPTHVGRRVARQAVAVRVKAPPEHLAALLSEFEAAGLDDAVADAVAALSGGLARPALDQVTRLLRDRDRAGIALRLSLAAVADRPVDDILRLTESLNEQGRPVDALNLLAYAAQVRSIPDLERLTAAGGPAARRVFAAVAEQTSDRIAALARALTAPQRTSGQPAPAPASASALPRQSTTHAGWASASAGPQQPTTHADRAPASAGPQQPTTHADRAPASAGPQQPTTHADPASASASASAGPQQTAAHADLASASASARPEQTATHPDRAAPGARPAMDSADRASASAGARPAAASAERAAAGARPAAASAERVSVVGGDGRWAQFRAEVLRRPDGAVVEVAAGLVEAGAVATADDLLKGRVARLAIASVAAKRTEVMRRLLAVAAPEEVPAVLRAVLDGFPAPGDAATRIAALLAGLPRRAVAETVAYVTSADEGRLKQALRNAVAARPVSEIVTVVAAVTRPDSAAAAHELLDVVARGPVLRVAELVEELRRRGERAHLRALVESFRMRHPDSPDVFKLAGWLWALDEHDVAALAVRGRLWLGEAAVGDALACAVAELLHGYAIGSARLDLAYPALGESAAEELRRSYRIADDEALLFVLSSPKLRKPTPVLFTQRAVHHVTGEKLVYADLADVRLTAGRRNAVVLDRADGAPGSWPMPTAAAAREVVELVGQIQALVGELHEKVLEGEIS
ncbi:MAG TPA: hypothetical protein VGD29_06530 [Actinoplanes sp.]